MSQLVAINAQDVQVSLFESASAWSAFHSGILSQLCYWHDMFWQAEDFWHTAIFECAYKPWTCPLIYWSEQDKHWGKYAISYAVEFSAVFVIAVHQRACGVGAYSTVRTDASSSRYLWFREDCQSFFLCHHIFYNDKFLNLSVDCAWRPTSILDQLVDYLVWICLGSRYTFIIFLLRTRSLVSIIDIWKANTNPFFPEGLLAC